MLRRLKNAVLVWVACLVMLPLSVCAQRPERYSWEQFVEEYAEYLGELTDDSGNDVERYDWLEELEEMYRAPLNINTADRSAFEAMHFLSDAQIDSLLSRRDRYSGGFRSLGELMTVRELGFRDRAWLSLLVTFGPKAATTGDDATGHRRDDTPWGGAGIGSDSLRSGGSAPEVRRLVELADEEHRWTSGTYDIIGTADVPLYRRAGFYNYDSDNYATKMFTGYNWAHTLRYRYNWRHRVMYGATVQQDVGERFGAYGSRPWDYQSAYVYYKSDPERYGRRTFNRYTVVAGDYKVHLGQGLLMGRQGWGQQTALFAGFRQESTRIVPHTGTDESHFFRGTAGSVRFGRGGEWSATAFASVRRVDGTVHGANAENAFDANASDTVTAWKTDGLHRTLQEIRKRNVATQWLGGVRGGYQNAWLNVGLNGVWLHYDKDYVPAPRAYNKYYMSGHDAGGFSIDYSATYRNWALQGEAALDRSGAWASTWNVRWMPIRSLYFILQQRSIAHDFVSPYGNTLMSNSQIQNEHGAFFGLRYAGIYRLELEGYVDGSLHKWPVYLADSLSHRLGAMLQGTYRARHHWTHTLSYRMKARDQNVAGYRDIPGNEGVLLSWRSTHHLRWQTSWSDGPYAVAFGADGVSYYSEGSAYDKKQHVVTGIGTTLGGLLFLRTKVNLWREHSAFPKSTSLSPYRLNISALFAGFNSADYNARCYVYQPQLQGSFSVPTFYGRGFAATILAECRVWRQLSVAIRYNGARYFDRQSISSGVNLIESPWKNDISVQLRCRLEGRKVIKGSPL